jgi:hypothetical protein
MDSSDLFVKVIIGVISGIVTGAVTAIAMIGRFKAQSEKERGESRTEWAKLTGEFSVQQATMLGDFQTQLATVVGRFDSRMAVAENNITIIADLSKQIQNLAREIGAVQAQANTLTNEQRDTRRDVHDLRNHVFPKQ